jgi:hypothetical protein
MIELIPISSYSWVFSSPTIRSLVGKFSGVHAAVRFSWISIGPMTD